MLGMRETLKVMFLGIAFGTSFFVQAAVEKKTLESLCAEVLEKYSADMSDLTIAEQQALRSSFDLLLQKAILTGNFSVDDTKFCQVARVLCTNIARRIPLPNGFRQVAFSEAPAAAFLRRIQSYRIAQVFAQKYLSDCARTRCTVSHTPDSIGYFSTYGMEFELEVYSNSETGAKFRFVWGEKGLEIDALTDFKLKDFPDYDVTAVDGYKKSLAELTKEFGQRYGSHFEISKEDIC